MVMFLYTCYGTHRDCVFIGQPCDEHGVYLPPGAPPPPRNPAPATDWSPFEDGISYELADFLYHKEQMSGANIDRLFTLWAQRHGNTGGAPFDGQSHLYTTIDGIDKGDAPWHCLKAQYNGPIDANSLTWKLHNYEVWHCDPSVVLQNMLDNPDFKHTFDTAPSQCFRRGGKRRWTNFMTGNYSWRQAVSFFLFPVS